MIQCAINDPEIIKSLYSYVVANLKEAEKKGTFDPNAFMQSFFNELKTNGSPEAAAKYIASLPKLILVAYTSHFSETNIDIDLNKLNTLNRSFRSENGINEVLKEFNKSIDPDSINAAIDTNDINENEIELKETIINEPITPSKRFRTFSPLTGTSQNYIKVKPSTKGKKLIIERIDPNKLTIVNTMASIQNSMNNQSITDGVIYQDKKLFFRAFNLNDFATGNRQQLFDEETQNEIIKARSIGTNTPAGTLKINERVVLILSDEAGNMLYFDEAGNISNEKEGKIVYQFLRPVRVVENKLVATNIYNNASTILTPKEIARATYKEEFGDKKAYLESIEKEQEEDLKTLKEIQDAALRRKPSDAAYLLPITGITNGVATVLSGSEISLENLLNFPNQSKDILNTIKTESKENGIVKNGGATIRINGEAFPIDRMRINEDIAQQISKIVINPKLTVQQKYDFIKHFIPIGMTKSVRNFDITYNFEQNTLFLKLYEKAGLINQVAEYNLSNTNLNNIDKNKVSQELFNALTKGYGGYPTFISYSEDALKNRSYRAYDVTTNEFIRKSYIDVILTQNPTITLVENNPGFFNYSLQFDSSTGPATSNIIKVKAYRTSGTFSSKVNYAQRGSGTYYALDKPFQEIGANDPVEEVEVSYDITKTLDVTTAEGLNKFSEIRINALEGKSFDSVQDMNDALAKAMLDNGYESLIGYIDGDMPSAGRELVLYKPVAESKKEPIDDEFIPVNTTTEADIEASRLIDIVNSPEYTAQMQNQGVSGNLSFHLNKLLINEIKSNPKYTKEFAREVFDSLQISNNFSQKQIDYINSIIDSKVELNEIRTGADVIQTIVKPESQQPHNNTDNSNKPDDLIDGLFRKAKNLDEKISTKKIQQSIDWWNSDGMKAMREAIDLNPIINIVNSDVYASFIVSAGTLANPNRLGKINYNVQKGSIFQNLTIYHEAWHAFSQLFLTPQQKTDLYNEMRSLKGTFTLENGETYSYSTADIRQLEEKLAEDFRNYMKNEKPETKTPVKNTLFRKILNFLKALFGKILKKFNKKDVTIDALNSPMAKELFNNLRVGNLNSYTPLISNAELFSLDRGVRNVENPREDVLSKQDSTQLVSAIDSIIAEIIDERYNKYKNVPGAKAITIATLVETQRREILLNEVREVLENKLKKEKEKLDKLKPDFNFNSLNDLSQIEKYASAKLTNKKGDHKYVFLTSQVLDFSKLTPSLKKGERVKGESYAGTIKIVSDFYKHNEIKNANGKPVDIIIVSNVEDAELQYNNYVKGKAKAYTGFEINQKALQPNLNLSEEESLTLDNIRILQLALNNWGDNKSGVLKYYLENTDYDVAKKKYETDYTESLDADGNVVNSTQLGEGSTRQEELNNDELKGKVSLQQLMSKETAYILKSLFKVDSQGNIPVDRFGFKQRADFSKVFNIVAKTIGGIRDRQKAYDALLREAEKFPEIKQLIESKYPEPNTTNTYEFDISRQFVQDFGKAKVKYMQLFATINDIGQFDLQSVQASLSISSIQGRWISEFKSSPKTKFINKSANNVSSLNLNAIVSQFKDTSGNLKKSKALEFAQAIGISLDTNKNIISELDENSDYYGLAYIFDAVKEFNDIQLDKEAGEVLSPLKEEYLEKFKLSPLETLKTTVPKEVFTTIKEDFNENTQIRRLAELQGKYGYDSSTAGVIRANGNTGYEDINYSSYSARLDALNSVDKLSDLWKDTKYSHMSYLNPNVNTYTKHLKILNSVFDRFDEDGVRKRGMSIEAIAVDGTNINDDLGNTTTELDDKSKFLQELHSMLLAGWAELPRVSEKKFSQGFRVIGGIEPGQIQLEKGNDKNLYVDINMFLQSNTGENYAIGEHFLGYLEGEFDRIKKFKGSQRNELLKITGYNRVIDTINGKDIYAGEVFSAFDTVLSDETKKELYTLIEKNINVNLKSELKANRELLRKVVNDIKGYFNELVTDYSEYYYQDVPYLSESLLRKAGVKLSEKPTSEELKAIRNDKNTVDKILKAYAYNDWIHKFETSIIMFGDFAQWNHAKEDWSKRIPGATSDGTGFLYDQGTIDFINNTFNAPYQVKNEAGENVKKLKTYAAIETAKAQGKVNYDNYIFSDTLNTAVIEDIERKSIYLDDMKAAWLEEFSKTYDKETAEYFTKLNAKAFEKMTEGDGMAYMTIDAYRALHKVGRGWSIAQENLYQKIINGEKVTQAEAAQYFPIYKLHYFGSLKNDLIATTAMHKFSVMPLIPGVNAKEGSQLDKLHKKMLRENVQYVTFGSGSKAANLTSNGKLDNIFATEQQKSISDDVEFTLNPIYLAYLKEVTVINDEFKGKLPIATQTRAIILDNLFENGKLKNDKNKPIVDSYLSTIKEYTNLLKADLLNEIGYVYNETTKRYEGNLTNFVEFIREQLGEREIPNHLIKLLNTTEDGQLAMDFSIHPESQDIEKLLMSIIQKRLIRQTTNGEPLVQAPTSFTNGLWDAGFQNITDPEEKKKLLGSNTLPFYLRGQIINKKTGERAATNMMKVAISMQGSYLNLLNQEYKGQKIGTIERLNELVKDEEWLNTGNNRKAVTIGGPRIPNDATNTIEGAEVWHFIDPAFGNTVIVPTEIVAKAGSDFDGDKLFFAMANIDKDGNYISKGVVDFQNKLKKAQALEKEFNDKKNSGKRLTEEDFKKLPEINSEQLIEQQKKYLQNKYIETHTSLLSLPENYAYLVTPNLTHLVDKYIPYLEKSRSGYDRYKNPRNAEPNQSAPDKDGKRSNVISPTRLLEATYNLYKHAANLSLEPSLGIQAKITKNHTIFKTIGNKMPSKYRNEFFDIDTGQVITGNIDLPMIMRFKHNIIKNKKGENVISLSGEKTQKGSRITDLNSHNLNGILDRAKNPFPFDLQMTPEGINVISYLTQAGVDEEEVFMFVNQPLIKKYMESQRLMNSAYFTIINGQKASKVKSTALNDIALPILNTLNDAEKDNLIQKVNREKLRAAINTVRNTEGESQLYVIAEGAKRIIPLSQLVDELNSKKINSIDGIFGYNEKEDTFNKKIFISNKDIAELLTDSNYVFTTSVLSKNYLPEGDIQLDTLYKGIEENDNSSLKALALFMNFIELEKQFEGMDNLQQSFSPDTSNLTTTQQVSQRKSNYKILSESTKIDQESFERLRNDSVVSSFTMDDLILDLIIPLFPLRLNADISKFISDKISQDRRTIKSKFGTGIKGQESFTKAYNNAIINFIYQNYLSNYQNEDGKLVNVGPEVSGFPTLIDDEAALDAIVENGVMIVNTKAIEDDFNNKVFLEGNTTSRNYAEQGLDVFKVDQNPFNNLNSYYRYVLEREALRAKNPIESLENNLAYKEFLVKKNNIPEDAYEAWLSERALRSSYNRAYIMGSTKYSYSESILDVIRNLSDKVKSEYPILSQIAPAETRRANIKLLQLNDKKLVKGKLAEIYYSNIRNLGDATIKKVNDPELNERISDLFSQFSLMMFYQHGIGPSKFGFTKALDPDQYKSLMFDAVTDFFKNYFVSPEDTTKILNRIYDTVVTNEIFKNYNVPLKGNHIKEEKEEFIESFDLLTGLSSGPIIITLDDINSYKTYLSKSNNIKPKVFFTPKTLFTEFYNNVTGKRQTMPESAQWNLNSAGYYDMIDNVTKEVYITNVDLETGMKMLQPDEVYPKKSTQVKAPVSQTNKPKGVEIQPGLEIFKDALTKEEQKEFYEFGKSILEKHGYNPFPQYVMASAGQMEWSPEIVVGKDGKEYKRQNDYNAKIISHKKKIKGSDGSGRWAYHYYMSNLDGSKITPIPTNIINTLEKVTGQDMSDYDTVLINLYPIGRTLGWHVDVSEDARTMDRDIISVSIGADADFYYANTPDNFISGDPEKAGYKVESLNFKSGDVMTFGGRSRLISHTVKNVTGTTDLGSIDLTNSNVNQFFKGGLKLDNWRMNFTFRVADNDNNKGKRLTTQPTGTKKTYSGKVTSLQPNQIFVFGSNPEGKHGAGAAKYAKDNFGAIYGQGEGLQGQSYALPTKDLRVKTNNSLRSISAEDITNNIKKLYEVAKQNPTKEFLVSDYSESNLNGYTGQEMADMFTAAGPIPSNIVFNENFDKLIQPSTQAVKGTIQLELIEDLVQQGIAKTTVRNYDKPSGIYKSTKTNNLYNLVNRGKVKMVGDKIIGDNVSYTLDEFGAAEGFGNWKGFVKAAKFAGIDLQKGKEVYLYDITPASQVQEKLTPIFDSLPGKSATPTMTYAGIGSRETPQEVLNQMTEVATYLESLGYTLNTGKTFSARPSADPRYQKQYEERLAFSKKHNGKVGLDEEGADRAFSLGTTQKNLFGVDTPIGDREMKVMEEIHPRPDALKEGAKKLMARNTNQVFGANLDTPVDFVLFYAKEVPGSIRPEGGTGQAVEMARRKGIPTINLANTNWRDQLEAILENNSEDNYEMSLEEELRIKEKNISNKPTIQEEDMKVFQSALNDNDGVLPNRFIVSLPNGTRTWVRNSRNLYDLVDDNTILLRNVNMETGLVEKKSSTAVDESKRKALIDQFTNLRATMPIDEILAEKGIDANDVLLNLQKAKTQEELIKIETEILKKLC